MAGRNGQANQLNQLRALAHHHLTEIEYEKAEEETLTTQAEAEIQRYAKISSLDRKKQAQAQAQSGIEQHSISPTRDVEIQALSSQEMQTYQLALKKDRFRPFHEILHRLRWDPELNVEDYVVGYLERFEGVKEMRASNWIRDFSDEDWIPMHRVRYLKRINISRPATSAADTGPALGIVWDRDERIDRLSRGHTIEDKTDVQVSDDLLSVDGTSVTGGMVV